MNSLSLSEKARAAESTPAPILEAEAGDFFALMKPGVMRLVLFTGFVGIMMAPQTLHPILLCAALVFMGAGAGAAAALNMWWEAELDAKMPRTEKRPIPQGRILPSEALGLGISLAIGSVVAMGLFINYLAAALLAFTILFYVVIYTIWLKPLTAQNIVIGGAAGALPPVIGWVSATGSLALEPFLFFLIIFLWTPPHFWALALARKDEYQKAGIPMLPNVKGASHTALQILIYSLLLAAASLTPLFFQSSLIYGLGAAILAGVFLFYALRLWKARRDTEKRTANAMQLFFFSLLYLFLLFALLLGDRTLTLLWASLS